MTVRTTCHPERVHCLHTSGLTQLTPGLWLLSLALLFVLLAPAGAKAQAAAPAVAASGPAKPVAVQTPSRPSWAELTPAQQAILKPLAPTWTSLREGHKRKWLQMAKSYPSLPVEEQAKMQGRMNEWVALSPQQRAQARLNFAKTKELSKELTPEEKKAKWQAYQSLSDEEKRKLAAKAPSKPLGAAPAAKPVAPQKLAIVPPLSDKQRGKAAPKIAVSQSIESQPGVLPDTAAPVVAPGVTPVLRSQ